MPGFICHQCGQHHNNLAMSYDFPAPAYWSTDFAKDATSQLHEEICIIKGQYFFVKGNIEIMIGATGERFIYTVWISLEQPDFNRAVQMWYDPQRVNEPSYPGQVANQLTGYPDMLGLNVAVHSRKVGVRPFIKLGPAEHPLSVEQAQGIEMQRVQEIAELMVHQEK